MDAIHTWGFPIGIIFQATQQFIAQNGTIGTIEVIAHYEFGGVVYGYARCSLIEVIWAIEEIANAIQDAQS